MPNSTRTLGLVRGVPTLDSRPRPAPPGGAAPPAPGGPAARFQEAYPDAWAERLAWLERELALDRAAMCRLAGLGVRGVTSADGPAVDAWRALHTQHTTQVKWLEETLTDLVHWFAYDWSAAAKYLSTPGDATPPLPLPADVPADAPLLVLIHSRSPGWTRALADFFGGRRAGT